MKNVLLASVALLFVSTSASFAAMPALDLNTVTSPASQHGFVQLAKDGGDDNGGDDRGGNSGHGGGDDDGDDDSSSNDDNDGDRGGDRNRSRSSNDDSNDDSVQSNSNRRKPRIPGGSGCDDAGDIAEHAECRAQ